MGILFRQLTSKLSEYSPEYPHLIVGIPERIKIISRDFLIPTSKLASIVIQNNRSYIRVSTVVWWHVTAAVRRQHGGSTAAVRRQYCHKFYIKFTRSVYLECYELICYVGLNIHYTSQSCITFNLKLLCSCELIFKLTIAISTIIIHSITLLQYHYVAPQRSLV